MTKIKTDRHAAARPGPQAQPKKTRAHEQIVALRKRNYSVYEISQALTEQGIALSAISVPQGRVGVTWSIADGERGRSLIIDWREAGGPTVSKPIRKGFGSELIERTLSYELEGEATIDFAAEGLQAKLIMPFSPQLGKTTTSHGEVDR